MNHDYEEQKKATNTELFIRREGKKAGQTLIHIRTRDSFG